MELKTLGRERKDYGLMATGNEEVPTVTTTRRYEDGLDGD